MDKAAVAEVDEVLVTVGVDTHVDVHVAVALDQFGRRLDGLSIPTTGHGHKRLPAGFAGWEPRTGSGWRARVPTAPD
ncbi:hypothetical protein [Embleya sp. NBC_00888]|uniref:hypothetical protein n=1 Tax=Embleya sp. NBC_00888 TaxID=2975960 RepID=UPI002F910187